MPNSTLNHLHATSPVSTLCFSGALTSSSVYLGGPGNQAGNGYPMLHKGYVTGISIWDGTALHTDHTLVAFNAEDKLAVYCQSTGSSFTIRVRVNGTSSSIAVANVPLNSTLFVTVELMLITR